MNPQAIKSQQYRWNKGGAETARKNFGSVLKADLAFINKVHSFFHLFNSSVFVFLLLAAILSVPMLYIKDKHPSVEFIFDLGIIFILGFLSITIFYWVAAKRFRNKGFFKSFITLYPQFLMVSMGLSLHNALAVIEGLVGRKTPFIRTPKFNVSAKSDSWKGNDYVRIKISMITLIEGLLCLYFLFGLGVGFYLKDFGLLFFHVLLMLGFGAVFYYSVKPAVHA